MERIGVLPGTEVGGYRVLAPLGHGGSGSVYRAVDADGRLVALKLLHPHLGADPTARERLRREVAHLQRVRHPAVARVLDAEIDSSDAFVVTELLDGEDLGAHVRSRGALPPHEVAELAEELRAALAVVHEAGVLHRDLSPGNVLMSSRGPVLIDFGIAQAADDARFTSVGLVSGTPGYVAPELLEGGDPGTTSDWWSWAALLAFAATGRAPYGTRPVQAVLARVQTGEADLAGLDRRTAATLRSALSVDPWRRPEPAHVVAELDAVAAGEAWAWSDDAPATEVVGAGTRVLPAGPDAEGRTSPLTTGAAADPDATTPLHVSDGGAATPEDGYADDGDAYGDADGYADPYADDPYGEPEHVADDDPDGAAEPPELPEPPRRTGTVLALGLLLVALAASRPGVALAIALALALVVRTVGIAVRATHTRQARRGRRRGDTGRALVLTPWYLGRALVGLVPAALVAASVVLLLGGLGWWLLDSRDVVLAAPAPGEAAGEISGNAAWVPSVVVALAVVGGLVALWWGPMSVRTRLGARWTAHAVAPRGPGAAAVVLVALAGVAALAVVAANGEPVTWWPLPGAPELR